MARDKGEARARFAAMLPIADFDYLTGVRAIPEGFAMSVRFAGHIYQDHRGNVIFPHYHRDGVSGYEIKNRNFTGFSSGGIKGLWCSRTTETDDTLVIGEGALDVLSYGYLYPDPKTRYFSTGGSVNREQLELIKAAGEKMPISRPKVILAMDNDKGGEALAEKIQSFLAAEMAEKGVIEIRMPEERGEDWNDVLRPSMGEEGPIPSFI